MTTFTFNVGTPIVLAVVVVVVIGTGLLRRVEIGHLAAIVIFAIYLVGVANFVILPLRFDPDLAQAAGPTDVSRLVELTPFFLPGAEHLSNEQLYLNLLLTVPFGFGLPFVLSVSLRVVVVVGFLFSVLIETAQLLADYTHVAMPTWSVDINDVILNTTGVVLGVLGFVVAQEAYRAAFEGAPTARMGPWRHFHRTLLTGRSPRRIAA